MPEESIKASGSALWVLKQLSSEPLDELGELLADRVVFWRYKNQLQLLEAANSYATRNAIRITPIGMKNLLPILDAASFQEDPTIQVLWSRLLVNTGVMEASDYTRNVAVTFLKSVKKDEATVLMAAIDTLLASNRSRTRRAMVAKTGPAEKEGFDPGKPIQGKDLLEQSGLDKWTFEPAVNTLIRYRILKQNIGFDERGRPVSEDTYCFTNLGWEVASLLSDKIVPGGF